MEADSILRTHTQAVDIANPGDGGDGDSGFSLGRSNSRVRAGLEAVAVGFTDSQSTKSIDFGWVVDVGDFGASFQKSQFALISVPAWTSRLAITVKTGWLGSNSQENSTASYTYSVPIPPDYEAFDAFIGGEEAVRRPQINDELMDPRIDLIACRKASILIPGLRLWRSAMVTVGSERADRITVLPNMRGIIAEFTKLPPPANLGPDVPKVVVPLRVWTSEGVDTQLDKITIRLPQNINECDDNPDIAKASATSSQMNPTSGNAATVPIQR